MEAGVLEEGTPKHTDITDACIHHILVLGVCAPIVRKQGITEIMESCVYNYMYPYCKLKNIIYVWYLLITVGLNDSSIPNCVVTLVVQKSDSYSGFVHSLETLKRSLEPFPDLE